MGKQISKEKIKQGLDLLDSGKYNTLTEVSKIINIGRHSFSNGLLKYFPTESEKYRNTSNQNNRFYKDKDIINMYNEMKKLNLSLTKYCSLNNLDRQTFSKNCKRLNLKIENNCNRKNVNEKYFDVLTEENCYWLGLLYADGSMYINSKGIYTLELNLIDKDHIEKFKKCLNSDHTISKKIVKSNGSIGYRICITNKYMNNRLIELGIIPNKTYEKIIIPDEIRNNKLLFISYLRGFLDGDGDIALRNNSCIQHVGFSSYDKESLLEINILINKYLNLNFSLYEHSNRCPCLRIHGQKNIKQFLDELYSNVNSDYYLERKYKRYKKFAV